MSTLGFGGFLLTFSYHLPGLWLGINLLFTFFGKTLLRIDTDKIYTRYQLWGMVYRRCYKISRQHILRIERTQSTYTQSHRFGQNQQKIMPQINIWAGTQKINLGGIRLLFTRVLSEIELDWLAGELSDWLNLPITRS